MQQHLSKIGWVAILVASIFLSVGTTPLLAASFSADMVDQSQGRTKTCKVYLLGHRYRLDVQEQSRPLHILVDRKSGKTDVVVPSERVYLQIDNDAMQSLVNNPFEALAYMTKHYESRSAGQEVFNGLNCNLQVIYARGKPVMTAWIATRYNFAVKLISRTNGRQLILKNLRDGGVKDAMLEVPKGYKRVESIPPAPPAWTGAVATAPILQPPFEKTLQAGQIIRIKPVRHFKIDLKVKSLSGPAGSFSANAFKDGLPLGAVTVHAGDWHKIYKKSPDRADEIVVRAQSGRVRVTAGLVNAP